jgi:hypothetical protein
LRLRPALLDPKQDPEPKFSLKVGSGSGVGSETNHSGSTTLLALTYLLLGESYPVRPVGGLKIHPGCVVVDPLLSVVAVSGHLTGLPLGKLVLSGSILCCSITFHFFTILCVLVGWTAYSLPSLCHHMDVSFWFSFEPSLEGLAIFCCFHCLW